MLPGMADDENRIDRSKQKSGNRKIMER